MGRAIAITRLDMTAADLRAAATQTKNASCSHAARLQEMAQVVPIPQSTPAGHGPIP